MAKEIVPLTSLRGVAAIAVILLHFSATMQTIASSNFPSLAPHGELAVDIFFVLSGFIMAYTYLSSFNERGLLKAYLNFLTKRVARIMPLNVFLACFLVIISVILHALGRNDVLPEVKSDHPVIDAITNSFMLPGIGIGHSINWPSWSISVEFIAYFLFPIFIFCVYNPSVGIFSMSILASYILIMIVCLTGQGLSPDGIHNNEFLPWRDVGRCVSEFVLGMCVYRVYSTLVARRVAYMDHLSLLIVFIVCVVIAFKLGDVFAVILFPPLVLSISLSNGFVKKVLSYRFFHFLGVISYSLYLVHENFRPIAVDIIHDLHSGPISPIFAMVSAAAFSFLMILPAWACYQIIEKPGRTLLRAYLSNALPAGPSQEGARVESLESGLTG